MWTSSFPTSLGYLPTLNIDDLSFRRSSSASCHLSLRQELSSCEDVTLYLPPVSRCLQFEDRDLLGCGLPRFTHKLHPQMRKNTRMHTRSLCSPERRSHDRPTGRIGSTEKDGQPAGLLVSLWASGPPYETGGPSSVTILLPEKEIVQLNEASNRFPQKILLIIFNII